MNVNKGLVAHCCPYTLLASMLASLNTYNMEVYDRNNILYLPWLLCVTVLYMWSQPENKKIKRRPFFPSGSPLLVASLFQRWTCLSLKFFHHCMHFGTSTPMFSVISLHELAAIWQSLQCCEDESYKWTYFRISPLSLSSTGSMFKPKPEIRRRKCKAPSGPSTVVSVCIAATGS